MSMMSDLDKQLKKNDDSMPRRSPMSKQPDVRLKLGSGDHLLRFLPPRYDGKVFIPAPHIWALTEYTHWNIPRSDEDSEAFLCIQNTYPLSNITCQICSALDEVREWARDRGYTKEKMVDLFGTHRLSQRSHVNCINRSSNEKQIVEHNGESIEIPKIWIYGMPYRTVYLKISETLTARDPSGEFMYGDNPFDPIEGHDVMFKIRGSGMDTRYTVNVARSVSISKDPAVVAAVCANAYDLSKWVRVPTEERLARANVLADRIKGIMSDPSPMRTVKPAADSKVIVGKVNLSSTPSGAPECYGNHVLIRDICVQCNFESQCSSDSLDSGKSLSERRAFHGMGESQTA